MQRERNGGDKNIQIKWDKIGIYTNTTSSGKLVFYF